jgi:hypothetical protein
MYFMVMHDRVWSKRKLERRLMLIYRRRTRTTLRSALTLHLGMLWLKCCSPPFDNLACFLRICLLWWVREMEQGTRLRALVEARSSLILRRTTNAAFSSWLSQSESSEKTENECLPLKWPEAVLIRREPSDFLVCAEHESDALVEKFRRRWNRPYLFELSVAFAKWAADSGKCFCAGLHISQMYFLHLKSDRIIPCVSSVPCFCPACHN